MQEVKLRTGSQVHLAPGRLYGAIKRLLQRKLIVETDERPDPDLSDERRRYYRLTELGERVLDAEAARLARLLFSLSNITVGIILGFDSDSNRAVIDPSVALVIIPLYSLGLSGLYQSLPKRFRLLNRLAFIAAVIGLIILNGGWVVLV